jgi:CheY-like chemotaxis protein
MKNNILWVDDEIELLESHIIYLTDKGYNILTANSGEDAIELCKKSKIDLILLDEMMTGIDGIETLKIIKGDYPDIHVIMVTKNEEEDFMEEAIAEKISYYLTKPVNPSQILMACKKLLENSKIENDKLIKDFLAYVNKVQNYNFNELNYSNWKDLYIDFSNWLLKIEEINNLSFIEILNDQKKILNKNFTSFVINNYKNWVKDVNSRPLFSNDLFKKIFEPIIEKKQLIIIVIDCFRFDQWLQISPILKESFFIQEDLHMSILPTATPFARNAIFSGMLPQEIKTKNYDLWKKMFIDGKYNKFEKELFEHALKINNKSEKSFYYKKIINVNEGQKFYNKLNDYKNIDILSIVVNFVDILGHSRSESQILKELIPNESAYRLAVHNWFKNSWLKDCLIELSNWDADIIITSDHGNTMVSKAVKVKADSSASSGVRYKYGRNLNFSGKDVLKIKNPEDYGLPSFDVNTEYIISGDNKYFVYSNQFHKYSNLLRNSFQHGGISLDEVLVPLIHLRNKK